MWLLNDQVYIYWLKDRENLRPHYICIREIMQTHIRTAKEDRLGVI